MIILLIKKIIDAIAKYLAITAAIKGLKKYIPYILAVAGVALLGFLSWCVNEFIRMMKQIFYPLLFYTTISVAVYYYCSWFTDSNAIWYALFWPYFLVTGIMR